MLNDGRMDINYTVGKQRIFEKSEAVLHKIFVDLPGKRDIVSLVFRVKG